MNDGPATTFLTGRFDDALAYASQIHREQRRKGSEIPYVSHLLSTAFRADAPATAAVRFAREVDEIEKLAIRD